jgi:DDE_Tnp_1-associated
LLAMTEDAGRRGGRTLWEVLAEIPDRRGTKGRQYPLRSILTLSLAATLSGANDLRAIFRWGRRLPHEALYLLGLDRAPCHATYHYFFKAFDVAAAERVLGAWARAAASRSGTWPSTGSACAAVPRRGTTAVRACIFCPPSPAAWVR